MTLRMRKGDLVQVVGGSDKGKQGRITEVRGSAQKVRVEGIRMQKRHLKPGRSGARNCGTNSERPRLPRKCHLRST